MLKKGVRVGDEMWILDRCFGNYLLFVFYLIFFKENLKFLLFVKFFIIFDFSLVLNMIKYFY